jgi:hypothetical protein
MRPCTNRTKKYIMKYILQKQRAKTNSRKHSSIFTKSMLWHPSFTCNHLLVIISEICFTWNVIEGMATTTCSLSISYQMVWTIMVTTGFQTITHLVSTIHSSMRFLSFALTIKTILCFIIVA